MKLYILPDINPDGDARSHDEWGRVNANGVDLNRNFPIGWAPTWNRSGCYDLTLTTSGRGPGSEPETRLVMNFIATHKLNAVIDYHSAGLGIFPGGTPWDAASLQLAQRIGLGNDLSISTHQYRLHILRHASRLCCFRRRGSSGYGIDQSSRYRPLDEFACTECAIEFYEIKCC